MHMQIQCPRLPPSAQKRKFCLGMITVRQTTKINMHKHAVYTQCTLTSVKITFGIRKCVWCLVSNHEHYTFCMYIVCHNSLWNHREKIKLKCLGTRLRQIIQISDICWWNLYPHPHIVCTWMFFKYWYVIPKFLYQVPIPACEGKRFEIWHQDNLLSFRYYT